MAIMIPSFPYDFSPASREDELFYSLEKNLSNDYYVFHSLTMAAIKDGTWKEKEVDFVIYNRYKGLMFVEAKAGEVWCDHGIWRYESNKEMKDPFRQADRGRWYFQENLRNIQKFDRDPIVNRCKMHLAVWFPSVTKKGLQGIVFPQNADPNIILTAEDLEDPLPSLERIFNYDVLTDAIQTNLSDADHQFMLDNFLCPEFRILPPKSYELDYKRKRFDAMIAEQSNLLNYLEYQRNAVINGAAGTGKTMLAVEKARRHSAKGETVLFLCYNNKLKDHLMKAYPYPGVSYYTIDGFACKLCATPVADYNYLESILLEYDTEEKEFPYQHIIVDEGQDFGQEKMHTDTIFELLEDIMLQSKDGTFYVFYDKYQVIQSSKVPDFIEHADCRLTLYKNCRNTRRIAETSFKPLRLDKQPKLFDSALNGDAPVISFCAGNEKSILEKVIKKSVADGMDNIQIVTCSTLEQSSCRSNVKDELYRQKNRSIPFTTVRKFKGLEAEHVILVDVTKDHLEKDSMLFYVGSSRAKFQLTILCSMDEEECTEVIRSFGSSVKRKDPKGTLARLLGCKQLQE